MPPPSSKPLRHTLEAAVAKLLVGGLKQLPLSLASQWGGGLLATLGPRLSAHETARRNLQRAFPDRDVTPILRDTWRSLGRNLFEMPHLETLAHGGYVEILGQENLHAALAEGRGAVAFSGHIGNWECLPFLFDQAGYDAVIMYRAPNNPQVVDLLNQLRAARRTQFVAKSVTGTKQAFTAIAQKQVVGFLMDHRFSAGIEVDFLGGRAKVPTTAALMVWRNRCPLIPMRSERIGPIQHRITIDPPLAVDFALDKQTFLETITQRAMDCLDGWIRERPEQWFWMQRLWEG